LKKNLLVTIGLLILLNLGMLAADRYWVNGTGAWNDQAHWSALSGGAGGASVPGMNDDVHFDQHSFSAAKQTVMITADGVCRNISWAGIDEQAIFSCAPDKKLVVYGSYTLSSSLLSGFKGKTVFKAFSPNNQITTAGVTLLGEWIFEGNGSWILNDDVNGASLTIRHKSGTLNTNDKKITCYDFIGSSTLARTLNLGLSEIIVKHIWDLSIPTNLNFNSSSSRIIFEESVDANNFRSGGLGYGSVSAMASACSPSGQPCAGFTITLVASNVTCNGLSNGNVVANVTGGSGNFSYNWNGPATPCGEGTDSICNLGAGNVTVQITDQATMAFCFCNINVLEPGLLFDYELFQIQPLCNGASNGSFAVDATGGTFPYTYSWSGGLGSNDTVTNVGAGTYTATVTDVNGCSAFTTITLNEPTPLLAPGTATMVTCNGFCDGTATVSPSGGTPPYTFNWNGTPVGDSTAAITNLCPGSFTVTVTDANGCTNTFDTTITQPPVLTLTMSQTNATCGGICNGTATATITGGTSQYTYTWTTGATTTTGTLSNTITGLCAGGYTITVTDENGCLRTDSVRITEPDTLFASAIGQNTSCYDTCDGTATAIVTGGTIPYNYNWNPGVPTGDGTPNISLLCPGTYTVTVGDVNGCSDTGIVTIIAPQVVIANPVSTNVLCFGDCNGTAAASPTGGTLPYTYNWTPLNPTGDGTPNISALCAGTYSVQVTDANGCDTIQAVTVTQPTQITIPITATMVTCNGLNDGTATANPSGGTPGYGFSWSPAPPAGQGTASVSGLSPGTYTVTVTDANGCIRTQTVTITQPNVLNATLNATSLDCNADCDATITSTVSGGTPGYSFLWGGGQITPSITNQCSGVYNLTVTDANGCTRPVSINITQPTPITLITSSNNVTCFGQSTGSASAIAGGGTPAYTYQWAPGGQTSPSINGQPAGSYTVTVTDANLCTATATVVITEPAQMFGNPTVVSDVTCPPVCNGSATANPTGGTAPYSFNWGPGTPAGDGTATITNLCAGNYTLITTDLNGCTSNQSVTITQPPVLTAPITNSTSSCTVCNGSATATPAGGVPPYSFSWSDPSGPIGQTTVTAVNLCPNVTYTVTVTDANNCTATGSVTILQTVTITITTSGTTLSCFGACDGIATANPSGGQTPYTYLWVDVSDGSTIGGPGSVPNVTGLCAGTYAVTVVDVDGCLNSDTVTFTNPPAIIVATSQVNASCGGICDATATANPSGGTAPFTFSWNTTPLAQTTQTATGLCAGSYTVTVTDASGCTATASVTITEQLVVTDNPTITDANCLLPDGSISVAPTGGAGAGSYAFFWTGPAGFLGQATSTITNAVAGAYTLTITTGAICTYNFTYLINNINGPTLSMAHTNVTCNSACDGTATVTAVGGTPGYTYNWTPGNPAGDGSTAITGLCGTITYTVNVTDASGCITVDTATVINPDVISPNEVVTNISCGSACDGTITLNPTGGVSGYTFNWLNPGLPPAASQTGLCVGAYTVTITDGNGCDTTLIINVTSPPLLTVNITSTNVSCNGDCDGTATAVVAGGNPGYSFSWSNSAILANVVNLCPNQYIVTVTDASSCTATDTVVITEPLPLTATTSQMNMSCNNTCDGIAVVTPAGGTPGYSFNWFFAGSPNNDTASALCDGVYNVLVTDANGCTFSPSSITITEPSIIVPGVTFTNPGCTGACSGTATAATSGGTAPYSYDWSGSPAGDGTASVTGLCAGTYTLTVTDSMGCIRTQIFTLTNPPALIANPSGTPPTCNNGCNGTATATPVGGTPGFTFVWSNGDNTQTVTNLCPGVYTVIVSDANSCADTQNVTITNPPAIDIVVSSTPAACNVCDGTISVNPISGNPGFTYLWSPAPGAGQNTPNVSAMCAGIYDVTVTDATGCDSVFTLAMNNAGGPTGETVTTTDALCNGDCNGTGIVVPIGGTAPYTFLWNDTPATANDTAINLCAGNYLVSVSDSNTCIRFSPVTINEPAPIILNSTVTSAVCSGVCTGSVSLATTGGTGSYTIVWSPAPGAGQGTSNATGLCPGTYTVTVTDSNNCVVTDTFLITQSTPLIAAITSSDISCSSACTGQASVNITSGTSPFAIQWNDPAGQTNDTAFALCAGTYTVTIEDALGCQIILDTTISATPAVLANTSVTNAACGLCDGSAVVTPTGGTAPYDIQWSNGDTLATSTGLCAGLYTVNITDSSGCTTNFSIPVSNTSGPTGTVITSTNVSCNGGNNGAVTAVTPSGGIPPYTFLWIEGGQTTQTLAGLSAGVYFVEVTDSMGCSFIDSVTITEPAPIIANQAITAATCGASDGAITITPSGGTGPYTVLWNTAETTTTITGKPAGIYSVVITDNAGCSTNSVIPINSLNAPSLVITSTNVTCNSLCNGTATAVVSGTAAPYVFDWNDVLNQNTQTAVSLCEGSYAVSVTGTDGCVAVGLVNITEPDDITFSAANATDPLCGGDTNGMITVIPSGGTLPYTYNWSPVAGTADTLANLGANSYTVIVTDANGCVDSQTVVLTEPPILTISNTSVPPTCNSFSDGSIDVTVGGGSLPYSFAWTGSPLATEDLTNLLSGTYIIDVTDANSCTISDTIVLVPVQTVTVFAGNDTTFCQSSSVILTATSPTAVSYQWFQIPGNINVGTAASVMVTPPTGTTAYYVVADNGTGCTSNDTVMVTSPLPVAANAVITNATCGMCDGSVVIAPTGGTAPYSLLWSNGDTTPTSTGLCSGLYTVNVTDSAGCVTNIAIPVSNTSGPSGVAITSTNILCNGTATGAVTAVTPSGGVPPYTYLWIAGGQTTQTLAGLEAGVYYLEVTDSNNCSLLDSVTITEPLPIMANASFTAPTCGASDGSITVAPSGGSGGYTFLWSPGGEVTATVSGKPAGIYTVTITDNSGCSVVISLPLNSQNAPLLALSSTNLSCNAVCDGTATVVVTGTAGPYALAWNDPASQTAPTATGLCDGTFAVTATGTDGCTAVGIVNITEPSAIGFSVANTVEPLCNGNTNAMITAIPSGGTLPYTYNWTPGGSTADTLANVGANSYTVTVTDANGCTASQTIVVTEPAVLSVSSIITNPSCNTISDGAIDVTVTGGNLPYGFAWAGGSTATTEDLTGLLGGGYIVTVTDGNGCVVTDSSTLVPVQSVNVFAGNDTTFCQNGSITLSAISTAATSFQWFQLGGSNVGSTASVVITPPTGTTSYYVQVDNGTGCTNSDTITISSNAMPTANAGTDATIIIGTSTVIGGSPTTASGNTIVWNPLPGLDNSTSANPVAAPVSTTTYTVTVTSPEGCSVSDSVLITVLPTIFIPDGISPNADGDNDEWIIDGIELFPNCVVEVYNRWGELLFQSVGYKERWKGTYKGKELPVGTYYYVIDLKDPLFPDVYTGPITILR
jgi:gliding motility-associated-like protein